MFNIENFVMISAITAFLLVSILVLQKMRILKLLNCFNSFYFYSKINKLQNQLSELSEDLFNLNLENRELKQNIIEINKKLKNK